jgi:hypothetical protein
MKATVVDKGEGYVTIRYEAQTNVEVLTISTCGMGVAYPSLSVHSSSGYDGKPRDASVHFGDFSLPVHTVLLESEQPVKTP